MVKLGGFGGHAGSGNAKRGVAKLISGLPLVLLALAAWAVALAGRFPTPLTIVSCNPFKLSSSKGHEALKMVFRKAFKHVLSLDCTSALGAFEFRRMPCHQVANLADQHTALVSTDKFKASALALAASGRADATISLQV